MVNDGRLNILEIFAFDGLYFVENKSQNNISARKTIFLRPKIYVAGAKKLEGK